MKRKDGTSGHTHMSLTPEEQKRANKHRLSVAKNKMSVAALEEGMATSLAAYTAEEELLSQPPLSRAAVTEEQRSTLTNGKKAFTAEAITTKESIGKPLKEWFNTQLKAFRRMLHIPDTDTLLPVKFTGVRPDTITAPKSPALQHLVTSLAAYVAADESQQRSGAPETAAVRPLLNVHKGDFATHLGQAPKQSRSVVSVSFRNKLDYFRSLLGLSRAPTPDSISASDDANTVVKEPPKKRARTAASSQTYSGTLSGGPSPSPLSENTPAFTSALTTRSPSAMEMLHTMSGALTTTTFIPETFTPETLARQVSGGSGIFADQAPSGGSLHREGVLGGRAVSNHSYGGFYSPIPDSLLPLPGEFDLTSPAPAASPLPPSQEPPYYTTLASQGLATNRYHPGQTTKEVVSPLFFIGAPDEPTTTAAPADRMDTSTPPVPLSPNLMERSTTPPLLYGDEGNPPSMLLAEEPTTPVTTARAITPSLSATAVSVPSVTSSGPTLFTATAVHTPAVVAAAPIPPAATTAPSSQTTTRNAARVARQQIANQLREQAKHTRQVPKPPKQKNQPSPFYDLAPDGTFTNSSAKSINTMLGRVKTRLKFPERFANTGNKTSAELGEAGARFRAAISLAKLKEQTKETASSGPSDNSELLTSLPPSPAQHNDATLAHIPPQAQALPAILPPNSGQHPSLGPVVPAQGGYPYGAWVPGAMMMPPAMPMMYGPMSFGGPMVPFFLGYGYPALGMPPPQAANTDSYWQAQTASSSSSSSHPYNPGADPSSRGR